ncbi:hypothetical protein GAMM_320007 [Gammaproteobacteria bacterium]
MAQFLTDAQLAAEVHRCEFCEEKPCRENCPANCSPADFIMAVKTNGNIDYERAANIILRSNPLGGVCGAICPEKHCMAKCVHKEFDHAINIPQIQATIIAKAKELKCFPEFNKAKSSGKKVAIIGAGPAGLSAASILIQKGYKVTVFEKEKIAGGACNFIPDKRLDKSILNTDIEFIKTLGMIECEFNVKDLTPEKCLQQGFDAVVVSTGLDIPLKLNIPGEEYTVTWSEFLADPKKYKVKDLQVAVIGGGAVATDCATVAKQYSAKEIDLICLENNPDMPLTEHERQVLLQDGIGIVSKTTVTAIKKASDGSFILDTAKINFPRGGAFKPELIVANTEHTLKEYNIIVKAIGNKSSFTKITNEKIFYAGEIWLMVLLRLLKRLLAVKTPLV